MSRLACGSRRRETVPCFNTCCLRKMTGMHFDRTGRFAIVLLAVLLGSVAGKSGFAEPIRLTPISNGFVRQGEGYSAVADGVRALIPGRAALVATRGAEISLLAPSETAEAQVSGTWLIHFGKTATRIRLGGIVIEAADSSLIAVDDATTVRLLVVTQGEGAVRVLNAEGEARSALRLETPYRDLNNHLVAQPEERAFLLQQYRALSSRDTPPKLVLEDPAVDKDRALPTRADADGRGPEIEIEDVEIDIEPGCIEVCRD